MKRYIISFVELLIALSLIAGCGPSATEGLPPLNGSPDSGSGDGNGSTPPSNGGGFLPPPLPSQSFATTKGGFVKIVKIESFDVDSSYELLGAGESEVGVFFLMERTLTGSVKVWHLFRVAINQEPILVCNLPRPGSSMDRYSGFSFDGSDFRIYGENSGYPGWTRIYTFDLSNCSMGSHRTITTSAVYTGTPILSIFGRDVYYAYGSQIRRYNQDTGVFYNWMHSTQAISGVSPSPLRSTFHVAADGAVWFMDSGRRLWKGSISGQWDGFAPFPDASYPDLYNAKYITKRNQTLKVITHNRHGGSLMIYHIETEFF